MGLDIVELVMAVEDKFGIEIADHDAEHLETVGAIHAYVWDRLEMRQTSPCANIVAFNRLRRSLIETLGIERRRIRPTTLLGELLPVLDRRTRWEGLNQSCGRRLPELQLPRPLAKQYLRLNIGGACLLLTVSGLACLTGHPFWGTGSIAAGMLFFRSSVRSSAARAVEIPASCTTVGTMVTRVLQPDRVRPAPSERLWTNEEAWEALRALVVAHLRVDSKIVTTDAFLVDDLGAD